MGELDGSTVVLRCGEGVLLSSPLHIFFSLQESDRVELQKLVEQALAAVKFGLRKAGFNQSCADGCGVFFSQNVLFDESGFLGLKV